MQSAYGGVQVWQMKFYSGLEQRLIDELTFAVSVLVDELTFIHIMYFGTISCV